ncbi:MAG: hypothetical protein ABIJ45_06005 [Candidatus Zixiibacteriota bacterium]
MALIERMPPKRVLVYGDPKDFDTQQVVKFIRDINFNAVIHDITKSPLNFHQLAKIFKHFDLNNFFRLDSELKKHNADIISIERRKELLQIMANDNTLLQLPIIDTGRLMTIGNNLERLAQMLEVKFERNLDSSQATSAA